MTDNCSYSFAMLPNWVMRRSELTASSKILYARLFQYAHRTGKAYPSQVKLANEIGVGDRQIRRCILQLSEYKLINLETSESPRGYVYSFPTHHEWMDDFEEDKIKNADIKSKPSVDIEYNHKSFMSYHPGIGKTRVSGEKFLEKNENKFKECDGKFNRTFCPVSKFDQDILSGRMEKTDQIPDILDIDCSVPEPDILSAKDINNIFNNIYYKKIKKIKKQTKKTKKTKRDFQFDESHFEIFWKSYPVKVGKGRSRKIFLKIQPPANQPHDEEQLLGEILSSLEDQKRFRSDAEEKNKNLSKSQQLFLPHWKNPSTWLTGECWLDEIDWTSLTLHDVKKNQYRENLTPSAMSGVFDDILEDLHGSNEHDRICIQKNDE